MSISVLVSDVVAKVEHYRGLGTDFEKPYQSIKWVIGNEKNLRILSEYKDPSS